MGCCSSRQVQEEVDMAHTASQPQPTYQQTYQGKAKKKKSTCNGQFVRFEPTGIRPIVCQIHCQIDTTGLTPSRELDEIFELTPPSITSQAL